MPATAIIHGGTVFDGTGAPGVRADVAVHGDRVLGVGDLPADLDAERIDATGLAVTPGFVNVLSHGWATLQIDRIGASELLQGVTTEVFGEAVSPGPTAPGFVEGFPQDLPQGARLDFPRLADGLSALVTNGVAANVASFVGGHNLRFLGSGFAPGPMPATALDRVRAILDEELVDGRHPPRRPGRTWQLRLPHAREVLQQPPGQQAGQGQCRPEHGALRQGRRAGQGQLRQAVRPHRQRRSRWLDRLPPRAARQG